MHSISPVSFKQLVVSSSTIAALPVICEYEPLKLEKTHSVKSSITSLLSLKKFKGISDIVRFSRLVVVNYIPENYSSKKPSILIRPKTATQRQKNKAIKMKRPQTFIMQTSNGSFVYYLNKNIRLYKFNIKTKTNTTQLY